MKDKSVSSCTECPHYFKHSHHPSCNHPITKSMSHMYGNPYYGVFLLMDQDDKRNPIPEGCPLKGQ